MTIVWRPVSSNALTLLEEPVEGHSVPHRRVGRMIQITLALYLLPAFLIVLVVGGAGVLILKICLLLKYLFERPET